MAPRIQPEALQAVGSRIRRARELADLSQTELAAKLNITPYQLYRYESGRRATPLDVIGRISEETGQTCDYLIRGIGERKSAA